ncbi:Kinesin motor domain-containing protein [Raphanus sativus]|nr:Kinesin motor domain-containing protein [Raphanus sativus]KAJ4874924.1 Kinesin motor domain-containing protein [Raphanus sativus]
MTDLNSYYELSNDVVVDMEQSSPVLTKVEQSSDPDLVNCGALSSPESSFELPSPPGDTKTPVISINSGSTSEGVTVADVAFLKDEFFSGGGTVRTDAVVGSEEEVLLYQTARVGDFDYK